MSQDRLLTIAEIAAAMRVSRPLVRLLVQRGELAALRPTPRTIRIPSSSFEAFLARKATKARQSA